MASNRFNIRKQQMMFHQGATLAACQLETWPIINSLRADSMLSKSLLLMNLNPKASGILGGYPKFNGYVGTALQTQQSAEHAAITQDYPHTHHVFPVNNS